MPSKRTSEFPQITTIQDTALLLLIQNGINYITTYGNLKDELLLSGEFAPLEDGKIPEEYIPSLIEGSGGYAGNLYLTNLDSSDIEGYKQISYTNDVEETIVSKAVNDEEALIMVYLFELPVGLASIDAGAWRMSIYGKVSATDGDSCFKFEVFKMDEAEEKTILFSEYSKIINNTEYERILTESIQPLFNINTTDRLGVKIYAKTTSTSEKILYLKVGDDYASFANTPLSLRHTQLRGLNDDIYHQHINTAQKLLLSGRGDAIAITDNDIEIPESGTAFLVTGTDDVNSITIDNTHQDSFEFTLIFQSAVTLCNKAVSHAGDVYPVYVAGDVNYTTKAGETLKFSFDATGNYVREIGSRSQADVEIDDNIVLTLGVLASEPEEAEEGDTYYNSTSKKVFTYTTAWDAGVTPTANVIYADIVNALNYIWNGTDLEQTGLGIMYIDKTNNRVGFNTTKPVEQLHVVGNTLLQKISITVGQYIAHFFKISTNINNQCKKAAIAFERTDTYGRGKVHILVENTEDYSNADLSDKALTINPNKSAEIFGNLTANKDVIIGGVAIFSNNLTDWGNSGATKAVIEVSTKINTLTLTDNCELTMPEFTNSISFVIKVTQDATGGRSLTIKDSDANTMVNLSEMDFSTGTANQKCWITVLWDGTEGCYTTSKWCN